MENATGGVFDAKKQVLKELKEMDLPYSVFYAGLFSDYVFVP